MNLHRPVATSFRRSAGFTLLEIVIVLGIISVLLGGAIFASRGIMDSSKIGRAESDFKTYETNLMQYRTLAGSFPTTQQGLKALKDKPTSNPIPRRWSAIMDKITMDPWSNEYIYAFPGKKNATTFEIISKGPDGQLGTADDLSNQDE